MFETRDVREIKDLLGKVLVDVDVDVDEVIFTVDDGSEYKMYHIQDCCESVYVEEIIGDVKDLIGKPILMAEEVTQEGKTCYWGQSQTWTFYKLATMNGYVTFRWLGESNGYYSEEVDFIKIKGE